MKTRFLAVLLTFVAISTQSQTLVLKKLKKELKPLGLQFVMPLGYQVKQTVHNRDLHYSFAIINYDSTMEIRYSFFPLKPLVIKYKNALKAKKIVTKPDSLYVGLMKANGMSMTNGIIPKIEEISTDTAKRFNADYAGNSDFEFLCEFGKGYKYGKFICLHKKSVADVIITFMSNEKKTLADLMAISLYALTFK